MAYSKGFGGKDDLGVFSPLSDASSPDFGNRTRASENEDFRPFSGQDKRAAALSSVTKRFHSKTVSESISKADKRSALPPLDSQLKDTALKRTMRADLAGITTVRGNVFSPLHDSDGDSLISSPHITVRTSAAAITSTPIMPFPLAMKEFSVSRTNRLVTPAAATSKPQVPVVSTDQNGTAIGISKSTQTNPFDSPQPIQPKNSAVAQSIQADFVRSVVEDCLDDFKQTWREDCYSLYAKLLRLFADSEQRIEEMIGAERLDYMRRLTEENEQLRAENERLKAMQFGKFFRGQ